MIDKEKLLESTESYLKSLISEVANIAVEDNDSSTPFQELGIDSFRVLQIIKKLEEEFGTLPKTLLFENFNISDLSHYFVNKHEQALSVKFAKGKQVPSTPVHSTNRPLKQVEIVSKSVVSQDNKSTQKTPTLILEKEAYKHPELGELVKKIYSQYKNEGSASRGTRNIAPNLFIGSEKKGYFNYSRSKNIILVYAYTGPIDYFPVIAEEMYQYCVNNNFELTIFSVDQIESIGNIPFSATPFGVLSRIINLKDFTLQGNKMRRLRYQVTKFEEAGKCRTEEYHSGSNKEIDKSIVSIIDQWCAPRTMVNPLIHIVKEEILLGNLSSEHRLFLTYLDDVLQNVILISSLSIEENGYLMDLEFYPQNMPLGGLEFAIVKIIEILAAEGCNMLSLGGTYGCKLAPSSNADSELDKTLDYLREQNIFNDEGNLQFKNKFRPENHTAFLCRAIGNSNPDNVTDIIMMIADPTKMQTSDEEHHTFSKSHQQVTSPEEKTEKQNKHNTSGEINSDKTYQQVEKLEVMIEGEERSVILSDFSYNPLNIPDNQVEFDLKTDSWSQLEMPVIQNQIRYLHTQLQQSANLDENLRSIFPFPYFVMTTSGRTAEHAFFKSWSRKGIVLQNLLFPTTIFHQIDNGFTPKELPHPEVFQLDSEELFKGNLDWDALQKQVEQDVKSIAFVLIEVDDNAAGGASVSMQHLKKVKTLLSKYSIPLVIDGTRIVENAQFIIEHEKELARKNIWDVVREIFSYADAIITSLTKDFCVNKGGLIATNDVILYNKLQNIIQEEGIGLDIIDKKVIALSLQNRIKIETQILHRIESVRLIWDALKKHGVPVVQPAGGHCILIDVKQIPEFRQFKYPIASFVAWIFLNTGIRVGAHNTGMQKNTSINNLVRLAIPVGMKRKQIEVMIDRLILLFERMENIPEILLEGNLSESFGDIYSKFKLKKYHNVSGSIIPKISVPEKNTTFKDTSVSDSIPYLKETESEIVTNKNNHHSQDIAIVGIAGRYPKSKNLNELWENLVQGKDCIETIPDARFAKRLKTEFTQKFRGGFIEDIDKFDSLFFNISPREAEMLDPQERLFLEVAWEAIEDAGYYPEILDQENGTRNIGVFVGAVWSMYQMIGVEEKLAGNKINPNSFFWSIANRVSYWMNLSGPSLTLDTACSSSLTAIYLACEAISKGECFSAIAGGVTLDLHQSRFDINNAGGALSKDGVCRSFGKGANGYVAGEGVGALFLKRLDQAIQDGDNIYGVIKSIVVNHGGRTSGYTVPNPKAQTKLILSALEKAKIDARSIAYIEAHGTGTELGDPIEITALSNAFQEYKVDKQSCPIGSIKTNVGHLEATAGIVSVQKVLLQMKHSQLVPSLHSSELNEFIDFKNSPFYVEQNLEKWNAKKVDGVQFPLRAGISSFGAGGANAHIIIEKYEPIVQSLKEETSQPTGQIFPLSARNEDQLLEMAVRLRNYIQHNLTHASSALQLNLNDITYTLQFGRKSFDHRLVIFAETKEELVEKLTCFIEGKKDNYILVGHKQNADGIIKLLSRKEKEEFINMLSQGRDSHKLAQLWIDGLISDWQGYQTTGYGKRVSLPTYPFADKRHWAREKLNVTSLSLRSQTMIHPLIDTNESTFEQQIFKKVFNDREFFIYDHLVSNIPTLPGVAYLDFARKAGELAVGRKIQRIKNILWLSPLTVKNSTPTEAFIELKPNDNAVQFEVYSKNEEGKKQLYSQGKLFYATKQELEAEAEFIDIKNVRARCSKVMDGKEAYPQFKSFGLNLGPSFQVLQEVFKGENEILGTLKIPDIRKDDFQDFLLHPSLVDGSLQVGMAAQLGETVGEMFVPYSIGEVEILHPLQPNCFSYIRQANEPGSKLSIANVLILDEDGKILVKIKESVGVPLVSVHEKPVQKIDEDGFSKLYYTHIWEKSLVNDISIKQNSLESIILFDSDTNLYDLYLNRLKVAGDDVHQVILVQPGKNFQDLGKHIYTINPQNPKEYGQLLDSLKQKNSNIGKICYAWPTSDFKTDTKSLKESIEKSVYSFLFLCQALIEQKLESKFQLLYLYVGKKGEPQPANDAINGFAKTLQLEHSKLLCKILEVQQEKLAYNDVLDALLVELHQDTQHDMTVRYEEHERYVRKLKNLNLEEIESSSLHQRSGLKEKGVYLITGGAGGLGLIYAEFLAKQYKAKLVLTGRSKLSAESETKLEKLRELGAEVLYVPADVSKNEEVNNLVKEAKSQFGEINGIIHSAGVLRDSYIKNKTREEMDAVLAPKIYGTFYLDEATQNEKLDFFVMFSSLTAVGGNIGQCDYAYANHFMDSFAFKRNLLQAKGERFGKSLSFNWSIWADGGMKLDEQTEIFFKKNLGIKPLSKETGIEALIKGLQVKDSKLAVLEGIQDKVELAWGLRKKDTIESPSLDTSATTNSKVPIAKEGDNKTLMLVQGELIQLVIGFLKLDAEDIELDKILLDLGFDSIGLSTFANAINEKYKLDITPILFFEYPSIKEISKYLSEKHSDSIIKYHQATNTGVKVRNTELAVSQTVRTENLQEFSPRLSKAWNPSVLEQTANNKGFSVERRFIDHPIAVVGMSGVMPQSDDIYEFWENLRNEKNMVSVIPKDRWNWEDFDGDPLKEKNKTNSKWGGFMNEVDKFDPFFFGISPREAKTMDPQQRIFLETAWKAIEDSGQKVSDLAGTRTGLFVGVATNDYADLMNNLNVELDAYTASGNSHSILANRVSFLLNLRGPSAPIDTACSSSLIALHRAIESIHTGSCDMAIVGGAQVMLTPAAYISFSMSGMLSNDGKCKSFDKSANGYVRGEGVGAIFLKPLSMAEADGNHIYAVIKSTAENHGGKVTSLTAPNPQAQAELLVEAYEKAQIDPITMGYIECHGTGTSLGDPIEIQALNKAFTELYKKHNKVPAEKPHIGLSTVKSNIGHLETAAGIAGMLKVLLSIKHKQIPATLHFEELNPYINLKGSPFYIVDKTRSWEAVKDENGELLPRRAGISSFGFGGANAHVVFEEYRQKKNGYPIQNRGIQVIALSAKNEDRLKAYAQSILLHITKYEVDLADLTYTLQVGRDVMNERLGIIVDSIEQLKIKLQGFVNGEQNIKDLYQGNAKRDKNAISIAGLDGNLQEKTIDEWIANNNFSNLLDSWVKGFDFDWVRLYGENKPNRISLPTYPFARERHWFDITDKQQITKKIQLSAVLHPLLHINTSDLSQQSYCSTFSGEEFFLKDHQSKGQKILPAAAYIEMIRVSVVKSTSTKKKLGILELQNVVCGQSFALTDVKQINIALFAKDNNWVEYEIYSKGKEEDIVHCQGNAIFSAQPVPSKLNIEHLKSQMGKARLEASELYPIFTKIGIDYGPAYQGVTSVYQGEKQLLAYFNLPKVIEVSKNDFLLHPSIMDGAFQASFSLTGNLTQNQIKPSFPFTVELIRIISASTEEMYAWVRHSEGNYPKDADAKLDIDLCDREGSVCVQMRGLSFQTMKVDDATTQKHDKKTETLLAVPMWKASETTEPSGANQIKYAEQHIILHGLPHVEASQLETLIHQSHCVQLQTQQGNIDEQYSKVALTCFENLQSICKLKGKIFIQIVIGSRNQEETLFIGLSGLLKTATLENPQLKGQIIFTDSQIQADDLARQLKYDQTRPQDIVIKYDQNTRYTLSWQEIQNSQEKTTIAFKDQGVYLITGGLGSLGLLFAKEILKQTSKVKIILTGRSELSAKKQAILNELPAERGQIIYQQLDITNLEQVNQVISKIKNDYKQLNGIIHCAGLILDNFILKKTVSEFSRVIMPKVTGTFNLDQASQDIELDFMVLFSSIVGVMGNLGQADYAVANGFMDQFAAYRNKLVNKKLRKGKTLSINWPLWQDGGMSIDQATKDMMQQAMGMQPMQTSTGIQAFYNSLKLQYDQAFIMEGDLVKMRQILLTDQANEQTLPSFAGKGWKLEYRDLSIKDSVVFDLKYFISKTLEIPQDKIDINNSLIDYGFDSISLGVCAKQLTDHFSIQVTPALFFNYQTINQLSDYLVQDYHLLLQSFYHRPQSDILEKNDAIASDSTITTFVKKQHLLQRKPFIEQSRFSLAHGKHEPIAIIGISGRFPKADTPEKLWTLLSSGESGIIETPTSRLDWHELGADSSQISMNKGGFIDGMNEFDPLFFNISHQEAEIMAPCERLLLMEVYHAIEDAGIDPLSLRKTKIGAYVGMEESHYGMSVGEQSLIAGGNAKISSRLSSYLGIHGPNIAINTACSSGLVALHQAVMGIQQGDCNAALVAGVALCLSPTSYYIMNQSYANPRDKHGDKTSGIAIGEAVVVLMLKPLSVAIADGDNIYGTIKASGINFDDEINGNDQQHIDLIESIYANYNIDVRNITQIVTHASGEKLTDSVEFSALNKVFRNFQNNQHSATNQGAWCAITNCSASFGHTMAASGLVSVVSLLKGMQYHKIPSSTSSLDKGDYPEWKDSPFYINGTTREWKRENNQPYMGGVSAFGCSGTNAHVVIEEFMHSEKTEQINNQPNKNASVIIPLSARTQGQLHQKAHDLLDFINTFVKDLSKPSKIMDLKTIAYTLQIGREAMDERLGILVSSVDQLVEKLQAYVNGEKFIQDTIQGNVKQEREGLSILIHDDDIKDSIIDKLIVSDKHVKLMDLWVKGLNFDWNKLYDSDKPKRVSLPTYPFVKDHFGTDSTITGQLIPSALNHSKTSKEKKELKNGEVLQNDILSKNSVVKTKKDSNQLTPPYASQLQDVNVVELTKPSDVLVAMQTRGNNPPIFGLPGLDGNALILQVLSHVLGSEQPFYGLQSIACDGKTPPPDSIEKIAMININAMKSIQPRGPYTFVAYSYGGSVAYEMARILLENNEKIASLIFLECICSYQLLHKDVLEGIVQVTNNLISPSGPDIFSVEQLKQVPESERAEYLYNTMVEHGFTLSKRQTINSYNISITNNNCLLNYRPLKLSKKIDVHLFRGIDALFPELSEDYGWNQLLLKPVLIHKIKSNHFSMVKNNALQEIVPIISNLIRENLLKDKK
ncbi:MAG: SDR family NAD(P)-dependent oxidoreductase [Bacteroidales bacterium]|nr:SDR family NAD(P)-dependent oxidoreductase [Bacteroidales bacterium]